MTLIERILGSNNKEELMNVAKANEADKDKRIVGRIIKLSEEGWGFISSKDIQFTRIFFHWTALEQDTLNFKDLKSKMMVEFKPVEIEGKGWRAIKIRVIEG